MFYYCESLTSITLPPLPPTIVSFNDMFNYTLFTHKLNGILISDNYYQSPSNNTFPIECWKLGMGLDDLQELAFLSINEHNNLTEVI